MHRMSPAETVGATPVSFKRSSWVDGRYSGGTLTEGWGYQHNHYHSVSYAWKLLPDGSVDDSVPELMADGEDHIADIFAMIGRHEVDSEEA